MVFIFVVGNSCNRRNGASACFRRVANGISGVGTCCSAVDRLIAVLHVDEPQGQ